MEHKVKEQELSPHLARFLDWVLDNIAVLLVSATATFIIVIMIIAMKA